MASESFWRWLSCDSVKLLEQWWELYKLILAQFYAFPVPLIVINLVVVQPTAQPRYKCHRVAFLRSVRTNKILRAVWGVGEEVSAPQEACSAAGMAERHADSAVYLL